MSMLVRILGWGLVGIAALGAAGAGAVALAARVAPVPAGLGVSDGRLAACPATPNCVSTQADPGDRLHFIEPVELGGPASEAQARIRAVLAAEARTEVLRDEPSYIHAVFRSRVMGFPDDVEFYVDEGAGLIHFRSASRLGRDDIGVNRARMERLRATLEQALRAGG